MRKRRRRNCIMQNVSNAEIAYIEKHPNEKANNIGRQVPFHLQYARKCKENNNN